MSNTKTKNILLNVTGSISCYKACNLISLLKKNGYNVEVVATEDALKFVGKATFEGLTKNTLHVDMFNDEYPISHIELAQNFADLIISYPCSANMLNRLSSGLCDDLFGAICLANNYNKPLLLAPAMNTQMFLHPSVQNSIKTLTEQGAVILPCEKGELACGDVGYGRLLNPEEVFKIIEKYFV